MHIRTATAEDIYRITALYRDVARHTEGIARTADEVTEAYVEQFVYRSMNSGLIIVALHPEDPDRLVGEVHAYKDDPKVFSHVLTGLTLVVHPDFQGKKIGRTLFTIFLEEIGRNHLDIGRVELLTRETNARAIALYQSLGFRIEGRLEMRLKNAQGLYEADIPMGWQNPNFEF